MKKALTFIAFAGVFSALLMTTGCNNKEGDCGKCEREDVKLTKVTSEKFACRECTEYVEAGLERKKKGNDNFDFDKAKKEKKGQTCDQCKETDKKVTVFECEDYMCKHCAKIEKLDIEINEIRRELNEAVEENKKEHDDEDDED